MHVSLYILSFDSALAVLDFGCSTPMVVGLKSPCLGASTLFVCALYAEKSATLNH